MAVLLGAIKSKNTGKYYIEFMEGGIERTIVFEKLPANRYKGKNGIIYVTRFTDSGTALIPLMNIKTNLPVKK
jgi:hypothetical protein